MMRVAAASVLGFRVRRHRLDRRAPAGLLVALTRRAIAEEVDRFGEFLDAPAELSVAAGRSSWSAEGSQGSRPRGSWRRSFPR
jgi:hypothetical protein